MTFDQIMDAVVEGAIPALVYAILYVCLPGLIVGSRFWKQFERTRLADKVEDGSDFIRMGIDIPTKYFLRFAALATAAVFITAGLRMPVRELLDGPWLRLPAFFWGSEIVV